MSHPLRVGLFPYLNVQPLVFGLATEQDCELVLDLPSRIAERFRAGALDLAMVPSIDAAELNAPILDGVCIGSDGPVETVMLHHRVPLRLVKTLALDEASRTSAALARILIADASGAHPKAALFSPLRDRTPDADAVLVIGDPAFTFRQPGFDRLDLGQEWRLKHELPFVFAVMVMGPRATQRGLASRVRQATERGLEAASTIARSYNAGVDAVRAENYLRQTIRYDLGRREKQGLALFYRRAQEIGLLAHAKEPEFHAF